MDGHLLSFNFFFNILKLKINKLRAFVSSIENEQIKAEKIEPRPYNNRHLEQKEHLAPPILKDLYQYQNHHKHRDTGFKPKYRVLPFA